MAPSLVLELLCQASVWIIHPPITLHTHKTRLHPDLYCHQLDPPSRGSEPSPRPAYPALKANTHLEALIT